MKKLLYGSIALAVLAAPYAAQAQYKWVGSDGKVSYSDLPPPSGAKVLQVPRGSSLTIAASAEPQSALPYALKAAVAKFPVVLYTTSSCAPCAQARDMLNKRGIPFSEKTLGTAADVEQLIKLGFAEATMPSLSVGREKTTGFDAAGFDRLLDAAGYPRSSLLPGNYKQASAETMATRPSQIKLEVADTKNIANGTNPAGGEAKQLANAAAERKKQTELLKQQQLAKQDNPNGLRF